MHWRWYTLYTTHYIECYTLYSVLYSNQDNIQFTGWYTLYRVIYTHYTGWYTLYRVIQYNVQYNWREGDTEEWVECERRQDWFVVPSVDWYLLAACDIAAPHHTRLLCPVQGVPRTTWSFSGHFETRQPFELFWAISVIFGPSFAGFTFWAIGPFRLFLADCPASE